MSQLQRDGLDDLLAVNKSGKKVRVLEDIDTGSSKGTKKGTKATKLPKSAKEGPAVKGTKAPKSDDTNTPKDPYPPAETDGRTPTRAPVAAALPTKAPDDTIGGRVQSPAPSAESFTVEPPSNVSGPASPADGNDEGSGTGDGPSKAPLPIPSVAPARIPSDALPSAAPHRRPTVGPMVATPTSHGPTHAPFVSAGRRPTVAPIAPTAASGGPTPTPFLSAGTMAPMVPTPPSSGPTLAPFLSAGTRRPTVAPMAPTRASSGPTLAPILSAGTRPTVAPMAPVPATSGPTLAPILSADTKAPFLTPTLSPYIPDPRDPTSFLCDVQGDADTLEAIDDVVALPLNFTYQLWLDNPTILLESVLPQVESAMTEAIANSLLTCEGFGSSQRRLEQGVFGVSSLPIDPKKEKCSTSCFRMYGRVTIETVGTTEEENMNIVCSALEVVQDPSTMTHIATTVNGVGGLRYESSKVFCGTGSDAAEKPTEGKEEQAQAPDSSIGGAATVGIILASAAIVLLMFLAAMRRRRRESVDDVLTEAATSKDAYTLQPTLSSPLGFGGPGYTILADNQSLRDEQEDRSDLSSPLALKDTASPLTESPDEPLKITTWDPFRLDQTDLPDRLSLQSSEGGSFNDGDDTEEDSQNLAQYVNPVQLAAGRRKSPNKVASPAERGLQVPVEPLRDVASTEDKNETAPQVASPTYPGLQSLLGAESDGTSTDDDRSVVQLFAGGVRLLKLSDLEANHNDDDDGEEEEDDAEANSADKNNEI